MMLMRDKSGRSGRRCGSQNPGTAIGLSIVLGGCAGAGAGLGVCAIATAAAITTSTDATMPRTPRLQNPLIRRFLDRKSRRP